MYDLLVELQRNTALRILSLIGSDGWIWIQLALRHRPVSATLRCRRTAPLTSHDLILTLNGKETPVPGSSPEEQAGRIRALLEEHGGKPATHRTAPQSCDQLIRRL